jgi:hypothetical protein
MKFLILIIPIFFICLETYSQKEIVKNGIKINKLDKKNKKQGSWFFFSENNNLQVSCIYKDDSIIAPIVFYKNEDSIFVRYPKNNGVEAFLLKVDNQWLVGSYKSHLSEIEIVGLYTKAGNDSFNIKEDTSFSSSVEIKSEVNYWLKKEIFPVYMFGTESLMDFWYSKLHSSNYIFSKQLNVILILNESGIVEKIDFPIEKNYLNTDEQIEVSSFFQSIRRWQPFFSMNKTVRYSVLLSLGSTIKY